jgi:hypothetical protein
MAMEWLMAAQHAETLAPRRVHEPISFTRCGERERILFTPCDDPSEAA